ncbi:MAG: tetratricopeptide repeat protein [Nostocales cyanobacterium]|nr:MAG: tetratricopeptide repeat protein [Nostocales cyanobacterium]
MTSSDHDYLVKRGKEIERRKRIITYISLLGFGGSMIFGAFSTVQQAGQQPQPAVVQSVESELQTQAKNYELVLQREPNNQLALEKLSIIKLQMGDNQGAISLLEKLVKLYPERQDYQTILKDAKKTEAQKQK